jgi:hypothetical protein
VLEKIGYSYQLELPDTIHIHDIFPTDKLRKAADNPLPGQYNKPPLPINITGDNEYEVDKVLICRKRYRSLEYHVSWLNYDTDLTWYKVSDLKTAPYKLRDFHLENLTQPGPPALLPEWLYLFQDSEEDYNYTNGDHPMTPAQKHTFLSSYR